MITLAGNLTLTFLWPKSVANAQEVFAAQTRFQISCVTRTGSRTMNDCLFKRPVPCNVSEPHECHALLQSILLRPRYILYDYQRSSRPSLQERKSERVFSFLLLVVFATMCQGDHFLRKIIRKYEKRDLVVVVVVLLLLLLLLLLFWRKGMKRRKNISFADRHRNSSHHLCVHLKFSLYKPILLFILSLFFIIVEVVSCTEQ